MRAITLPEEKFFEIERKTRLTRKKGREKRKMGYFAIKIEDCVLKIEFSFQIWTKDELRVKRQEIYETKNKKIILSYFSLVKILTMWFSSHLCSSLLEKNYDWMKNTRWGGLKTVKGRKSELEEFEYITNVNFHSYIFIIMWLVRTNIFWAFCFVFFSCGIIEF